MFSPLGCRGHLKPISLYSAAVMSAPSSATAARAVSAAAASTTTSATTSSTAFSAAFAQRQERHLAIAGRFNAAAASRVALPLEWAADDGDNEDAGKRAERDVRESSALWSVVRLVYDIMLV